MALDIKQAYRRLLDEAFGNGNFEVFDEICDQSFRSHDPVTGDSDLKKVKETARMYKTAFPDLKPTILATYADGDTVIVQWRMTGTHQKALMNIQPTGKQCTVDGVNIGRFRSGKLVEDWVQWDALGLMRQLGVAPPVQTGAGATQPGVQPHA